MYTRLWYVDNFFRRTFLTNFFDEIFWTNFFEEFKFFLQIFLTNFNFFDELFYESFQQIFSTNSNFSTKGNRILRYGCRIFEIFWVPDDIESCNFQNLLDSLKPLKIWCHLDNFYFLLFHGGDQREKSENPKKHQMSGIHIWESCSPFKFFLKFFLIFF